MVRGLYTAAAGALVAQAKVDTIANNLANVNTVGFKRSLLQVESQELRPIFRIQRDPGRPGIGVGAGDPVGGLGSGSRIYDTPADYEQGSIKATGRDLDVALAGPGFFRIRDGNGNVRYTRDGSFQRDAQGNLVAANGDRVLTPGGTTIQIPDRGKVAITRDGQITVDGLVRDRIGVVEFANAAGLRPEGASRFVDTGDAQPRASATTSLLQGSLENSNADVVHSMVDLIAAERWFDANQKVIQTQDEANGQAIQTVGRANA